MTARPYAWILNGAIKLLCLYKGAQWICGAPVYTHMSQEQKSLGFVRIPKRHVRKNTTRAPSQNQAKGLSNSDWL